MPHHWLRRPFTTPVEYAAATGSPPRLTTASSKGSSARRRSCEDDARDAPPSAAPRSRQRGCAEGAKALRPKARRRVPIAGWREACRSPRPAGGALLPDLHPRLAQRPRIRRRTAPHSRSREPSPGLDRARLLARSKKRRHPSTHSLIRVTTSKAVATASRSSRVDEPAGAEAHRHRAARDPQAI